MAKTRCVAKALLLDEQQHFLLLKRSSDHPMLAGFYDLPGGTVVPGEEFGAAVIREIAEETGISVDVSQLNVLYATTKFLHGHSYPTLLYIGHVTGVEPEVTISWEHQSYEWASLDRLSEVEPQLAPTYREALDYIRQHSIIEDLNAK